MRKISRKLVLPAIAAAGVVTGGFMSSAKADFVVSISAGTVVGSNTQYTASIINNGANSTGTTILGADITFTSTTAGKFIVVDNSQDLDGDGTNDFNIQGTGDSIGSSLGTFLKLPNNGTSQSFQADKENGVSDTTTSWSSYNAAAQTPNAGFNPSLYQSLTSLELVYLDSQPNGIGDSTVKAFANIVVPTGTGFVISGKVGSSISTPQTFTPVTVTGSGGGGGGSTFPIIVLKASAGSNTGGTIVNGNAGSVGSPQGTYTPGAATSTLTVTGGGGAYAAGFIHSLTAGTNAGNTATGGFSGGDTEIFLLNISDTANGSSPSVSDINTIIADINNVSAGNSGVVASTVAPSLVSLGGVANPWDIELTFASPANQNGNFGFNFAGETNVAGVTVTDIAAVPEPATAGLLLVGGLGLLARRRRSAN